MIIQSLFFTGDHYGISNSRNETLAPLLGKDPETWSSYDNAMLQRVPYMIHIPGSGNGKINTQYGGQVDSLPTLLHLLGVETKDNILLGTDLLSPNHDQTVAFRDGNFVSPKYTVDGSSIYDTETGVLIEDPSEEVLAEVEQLREDVTTQLSLSDSILTSDLLRFYTPEGLVTTDPADYDYRNQLQRMKAINESLGTKATSIYSQNGNKSTIDLYKTDAPELTDKPGTVDESLPAETETPDVEVTE